MQTLLKSIARWLDRADTYEIAGVLLITAVAIAIVTTSIAIVIHGFPH